MTTRIRVALATAAITLAALALTATAQAAPADFTWSTTVSTAQAGGHPNLAMNYASSSTQALTRLDVDLPQGLMHRNNLTGACSNPLYQSDSCPASSQIGTVSAQLAIARVRITVPGAIYQLSAPTGDADTTFGIVLRPPLSSLGLTSKIYVRDQISFTNGGGLRHSLVGTLDSVSVLGVAIPSRIAQLTLTFAGQSGGNALLSNPTSCRTQQFTATGTFSDGTSRPRTSSYATSGCQAVPFSPTAEAQIENPAADQRTNFALLLGNVGSGAASALHTGHVVLIGHDFAESGRFDLEALAKLPGCDEAAQNSAQLSCPAESKLGDITAEIEGFGAVTGAVYRTNSPGHKTIAEITLRKGVTARFTGSVGGANGATITFAQLPQLPFNTLRFRSTRSSLWISNTCAIRTSKTIVDSFSGGHVERRSSTPAPDCTPVAPTITAGPERGITINTSHVEYRFSSPDNGVTFECQKDDSAFAACASPFVDDWQGEGAHSFSVRGVRGTLAGPATTATFTIDTIGPVVAFDDPVDADSDGDGVADAPFRDQGATFVLSASDATSGLDLDRSEVWFQNTADPNAPKVRGKGPRPHTQGHVQVGGPAIMDPGPTTVTVTLYDFAGHVTVLKLGVIVDGSPPSIAIDEPGVHFADGPDVEIPITTADDSLRYPQGEIEIECARKGWDGTVKGSARVITDRDSGRSKGFCVFEDVPEGQYKVEVKGWDPVRKEGIAEGDLIVDRTPPTADLADPPGSAFRDTSFAILFTASDEHSGIDEGDTGCELKSTTAGVDVLVAGSKSISGGLYSCDFTDAPGGPALVTISVLDRGGHVTVLKSQVIIDDSPPSIAIDEPGVHFADGPNVEIPITVVDDSLKYEGGEVTGECSRKGWDGTVKGTYKVITDRDSGRSKGFCTFTGVEQGSYKVTVKGWDPVKKEGVAETDLIVDRDPPILNFVDTGDLDSDGDGFADNRTRPRDFAIELKASDSGSGIDPDSGSCLVKPRKGGVIKGNVVVNNGSALRCSFNDVPEGDADIEIGIADRGGHVTVLKMAVTVDDPDPTPPVITIGSPAAGQIISQGSPLQVSFSVVGAGPYTYRCLIDSIVVLASCPSPSVISTVGIPTGAHTLTVVAYDSVGNDYSASRPFSIASSGGGDVCIAIYPPPPGCPGYIPPGGGGVIVFP